MNNLRVEKIKASQTYEMITELHYAKRKPSISFAFGLFEEDELIGCITIGKPASHSLCIGVCGEEHSSKVFELNRLILLKNEKNYASFFVSQVLKQLKQEDLIIVSYADTGMNHNGYVYQATNFIYTGETKTRTDKYVPSGKHSRHYTNDNNHLRRFRTGKHRYIFFTGKSKRAYLKALKYEVQPYPKGANKNYELGSEYKTKIINKITGEEWYE